MDRLLYSYCDGDHQKLERKEKSSTIENIDEGFVKYVGFTG